MTKSSCVFILFFCLLFIGNSAKAHQEPTQLWAKYQSSENKQDKIKILFSISEDYQQHRDAHNFDSTINIAIDLAGIHGNDALLVQAYWKYFSYAEKKYLKSQQAQEHAKNLMSIAKNNHSNLLYYYAYAARVRIELESANVQKALDEMDQANYYVNLVNSDSLKIENYLTWGKCLQEGNNKLDAFRNYLNALFLAQKNRNTPQISASFHQLSHFYLLIGNFERAKSYKLKQIGKSLSQDSLSLMYDYVDLVGILFYNKESNRASKIAKDIIDFAHRKKHPELADKAISRQRIFFIDNGLYDALDELYTKTYPDELENLHRSDTLTYYRTMALMAEAKGQFSEAKKYYEQVARRVESEKINPVLLANIHRRYGQFLLRRSNLPRAISEMTRAFETAESVKFLPYLVETSSVLDSLYVLQGNTGQAYKYAKLNKKYSNKQNEVIKRDEILQLEIDNESKQQKLLQEQEQEQTERRHNLQYMGIIILMISVFIILLMLGSFSVPKWVIESLGFFAFIFLFEFVILLLDHKIMEITHHEPWKMLALKVILISFLLPLHHWVEHKVVHYLLKKKLIDTSKFSAKKMLGIKGDANVIRDNQD